MRDGHALRQRETLALTWAVATEAKVGHFYSVGCYVLTNPLVGAEMQEERSKVSALQSAQVTLQTELRETRNQELQHRRGLLAVNEELNELKRRHERQIQELEERVKQLEREHRDAKADCRLLQNDLKMERETSVVLKATVAQHANVQMNLQAQLDASQRLAKSLQTETEKRLGNASEMQYKLEAALKRNEYLEAEALVNEQIRRKLHNQIQELKGNVLRSSIGQH
jgi:kinesin family protein C1